MSKNPDPYDTTKTDVRRYDDNAQIAQAAVSFIRSLVTSCGLVPRETTGPDLGIDMWIEDPTLRSQDNQYEATRFILAQIKGTVLKQRKRSIRVEKAKKHFNYWLSCAVPVVLIQVKVNRKKGTEEPWHPRGTRAIGVFITKELQPNDSTVSWRRHNNIVEMRPITMRNPQESAKKFNEFIENARTKKFPSWTQALGRTSQELLSAGDHQGALTILASHTHPDAIVLRHKVWRRTVKSKKKWDQKSGERTRELTKIGTAKLPPKTRSQAYRELAYGHIHSGLVCKVDPRKALQRFLTANRKRKQIVEMEKDLNREYSWECANHELYALLMLDWMQRSWPISSRDCAGLARRAEDLWTVAQEDARGRADGIFTAWRTWLFLADVDPLNRNTSLSRAKMAEKHLARLFASRRLTNSATASVDMITAGSHQDFLLMRSYALAMDGERDLEKASILFDAAKRALKGILWYPELEPWIKRVGKFIQEARRERRSNMRGTSATMQRNYRLRLTSRSSRRAPRGANSARG